MERQMRQKDSLIQPRTLCVFWNGLRVSERFHKRSRERSRERSAERFHERSRERSAERFHEC